MKKILLLLFVTACNSTDPEKDFSTADPNVLAPDSNTIIDRDNPYDSSYSVALDSHERAINAADTVRGGRK